jgi:hypothetical protein
MPPRPSMTSPAVCPSCDGFLGWHPSTCLTCRRCLEKYRPDLVVRVWGYDPRCGQIWADRLDSRSRKRARATPVRGTRRLPRHR